MRFTMPTFRTQAGAYSAPRKGTAHATSTLSTSTLSTSTLTTAAALLHSATFSSVHQVFLLVHAAHSPATASTAPAATGHEKRRTRQFAPKKCSEHVVDGSTDEANHPYA